MAGYLLKADAELFARIDAAAGKGKRAEWIRVACEMRLGVDCPHRSDCAVHNAPAYPNGACNCGADGKACACVPEPEPVAKAPKPVVAPRPERKSSDRWSSERSVLLGALRVRPMDERTAARELGWSDGLVSRVATELSHRGEIRFERGLMVAA